MSFRLPNPSSLSQDERMQYRVASAGTRYSGTTPEILADGSAIFSTDDGSRFFLKVFAGKALRPCSNYYYRSAERRNAAIEEFKNSRAKHHTARLIRRTASKQAHSLAVDAILYTCWGYEQTNTEFYQVIGVSGSMVTLRQIASNLEHTGNMTGRVTPTPGHFVGEPIRRRVYANNTVKIDRCSNAWAWDGRPKSVSWYA